MDRRKKLTNKNCFYIKEGKTQGKCVLKVAKLPDSEEDACSNCSNQTNFTFLGKKLSYEYLFITAGVDIALQPLFIYIYGCWGVWIVLVFFWKAQNSTVSVLIDADVKISIFGVNMVGRWFWENYSLCEFVAVLSLQYIQLMKCSGI